MTISELMKSMGLTLGDLDCMIEISGGRRIRALLVEMRTQATKEMLDQKIGEIRGDVVTYRT